MGRLDTTCYPPLGDSEDRWSTYDSKRRNASRSPPFVSRPQRRLQVHRPSQEFVRGWLGCPQSDSGRECRLMFHLRGRSGRLWTSSHSQRATSVSWVDSTYYQRQPYPISQVSNPIWGTEIRTEKDNAAIAAANCTTTPQPWYGRQSSGDEYASRRA